jgi:putative NADPH-quinone reductase
MRAIIILGSARSDGNTRRIVDQMILTNQALDIIDLNQKEISYFDYSHSNQDDDFISVAEKMLEYDLILFVTPVYWYSMSAVMKTFFDRITDLLTIRKDLGRKLRGKSMGSVSCGSPGPLDDAFFVPFKESANYLGMTYTGHIHTWIDREAIPSEVVERISVYIAETTGFPISE